MYKFSDFSVQTQNIKTYNVPHDILKKKVDYLLNIPIDSYSVAVLIPVTSKNRNWQSILDCYLVNYSIKSIINTNNLNHKLFFYIGCDSDDKLFASLNNQQLIKDIYMKYDNINFKFIHFKNIEKGHVTKMWNILFNIAYTENNDYFLQCGDDIIYHGINWLDTCIKMLKLHNNIGVTGPRCNNKYILTQTFVSRRHMEIFGLYFPEQIKNWGCDDWICRVYQPKYYFPLGNYYANNAGGAPRYYVNFDNNIRKIITNLIINGRKKFQS